MVLNTEYRCQMERVSGHLVSSVDWLPGTARAPVSLSHYGDEA